MNFIIIEEGIRNNEILFHERCIISDEFNIVCD